FEDDRGEFIALRRFRGQRILLNFWQSWSKPCLKELRRLQELHDQAGRDAPFIVALCGDREPTALAGVRRENNLSFSLVHDRLQQTARYFKVRCWPSTVSINPEGIIDRIQFGLTHEPGEESACRQA
ncbi:MAG: peroxiredoxin family protein, partial [Gammaproteobacteria bacterium]